MPVLVAQPTCWDLLLARSRSKMTHRRRAASKFNYIILKLLTLPYTYFFGTQTTLPRSIVCLPNS
jgi:hypothetical protein